MSITNIVIFGFMDFAQLAKFYFENDPAYRNIYKVVAFTVNEKYIPKNKTFEGLPIVPFESINQSHPPNFYKMFVPMTGKSMNTIREKIYNECKFKGYQLVSYISSWATILTKDIGENCFILEDNTIQPFVKIGNNCVFWSGNHIGHHSVINDHNFFTSHVVLSGHCVVHSHCWFGVNSTIRNGAIIAKGTLVAMSASLTKNTEEGGVYMGVPAKKGELESWNEKISAKL